MPRYGLSFALCVLLFASDGNAQQFDSDAAGSLQRELEKNNERFSEFLVRTATDFESPNQSLAIGLLERRGKRYPDFDEVVEQTLGELRQMLDLLEQGQIGRTVLTRFPLVATQVDLQELPRMLTVLLQTFQSDQPEIAATAMRAFDDVTTIFQSRLHSGELLPFGEDSTTPEAARRQKTLEYARKIFARYDTNANGKLEPEEYSKMLVSPANADTNGDQVIDIAEYAQQIFDRAPQEKKRN